MQQDYESPGESGHLPTINNYGFPQHFHQTAGEEEEDCGCNKGFFGTYGPEVKRDSIKGIKDGANALHHPDYHQYQPVQSQRKTGPIPRDVI